MLLGRVFHAVAAWSHCSGNVNASEVLLQHRINVVSTKGRGLVAVDNLLLMSLAVCER